jgi:hypothetical protein
MKLYCTECFAKTEYKFSKPKFCPECGAKVGALNVSVSSGGIKTSVSTASDNQNLVRIKELELELEKIRASSRLGHLTKSKNLNEGINEDIDDEIDEEESEDYLATQRHIANFKRSKNKSGIVIERSQNSSGVTFGQLIENASKNPSSASADFLPKPSAPSEAERQNILNQLRAESSSQARVIEIE